MSFTSQPLDTPVAPTDNIKSSRPTCNIYGYDDENGFRIAHASSPNLQQSSVSRARTYSGPLRRAFRKPAQLSIPPSLPENGISMHRSLSSTVASDPGSTREKSKLKGPLDSHRPDIIFGGLVNPLQNRLDNSSDMRPVTPPPVLAPSIASSYHTPNISPNISPSHSIASRKCACGNPEPIVGRSRTFVSPTGSPSRLSRLRLTPSSQKRSPSTSSTRCVCKWAPVVADAKLVPMAQTHGPRVVSLSQPGGSPLTALPTAPDASWVGTTDVPEIPARSPHRWIRLGTVFEIPGRESGSTAGRTTSQRGSYVSGVRDAESEKHESLDHHRAAALANLEGGSGAMRSTPDRLRRSLFVWAFVRLAANAILFIALLCTALLLVWPMIEGAQFPTVNYTHDHSIGKQVVTVPVPATLAAKLDQAGMPQPYLVNAEPELSSATTTGANDIVTTLTIPYSAEAPLSSSPFVRTVYAEFRTGGFPALVIGLALMHLASLFGSAFSACSLSTKLNLSDGWKGNGAFADPDAGRWNFVERTIMGCKEWLRGIDWRGHRAHCVTAGRLRAIFAVIRAVYVVLVLIVMAILAVIKVKAGKGV